MNILLCNPPWVRKGYYAVRAGSRWPHFEDPRSEYMPFPFFLAHACSLLEKNGFSPSIIDALALKMGEKDFIESVSKAEFQIVAMEVSSFSLDNDLRIARKIKDRLPDCLIVFMGLSCEMRSEKFLNEHQFVDYVLINEYELTLLELVKNIEESQPYKRIDGAIFIDPEMGFSGYRARPAISNLDELPWPSRSNLPMEAYHDEPGCIPRPSVQMWSSRGCPFQCIFCAWPQIMYDNSRYRTLSVKDVVDEFEWLVTEWHFKSVYFDDDTFNVNRNRTAQICEEIIRRGLKVPWAAMCRADLMDEELIILMKKAGVHALKFGVESANQNLLDAMHKKMDLQKTVQNIHLAHHHGIQTHLTFIFGLPGESAQSCEKTLELALELNPVSLQFTIAAPFPGSRFMEYLENSGHLVRNITAADGFRTSCIRTESMSAMELEKFVRKAQNRWQIHKAMEPPEFSNLPVKKGMVSVIIPNFNGEAFIRNAIQSILNQDYRNIEIIVIDNASEDKSTAIIRDCFPQQVRLLEFNENCGFSGAVNAGIKLAGGDFIVLLNNDATLSSDWISKMTKALNADAAIGFGAGKIICHHRPELIDSAGDAITSSGRSFNIAHLNYNQGESINRKRWVMGATGAACIFKRHVLTEAGEFDEDFFLYLEDVDMSLRCQLLGYKCIYEPDAVARHIGSAVSERYAGLKTYYLTRNYIFLLLKTFPLSILKAKILYFFCHLLYMFTYHTLISRTPVSFISGLLDGLKNAGTFLVKRRKILGARRINDEEFSALLQFGDINWRITRKNRAPRLSNKTINISKDSSLKSG
jgi:GT2 family glycosyltransferase/radical SAM superfamily enzyme YgiQ (UPF0313 family)